MTAIIAIPNKEPQAMPPNSGQSHQNIQLFVNSALDAKQVWGLQSPKGDWAVCDSIEYEDTEIYLFFSDKLSADKLCSDAWSDYQPAAISLDDFLKKWLAGMHDDERLMGLNWATDLDGEELEPGDVAEIFFSAAEKGEA